MGARHLQERARRVEGMPHEGCTQPRRHAGYDDTSHHQQRMTDIKSAILAGHWMALCGVLGRGKTVTLRRLHPQRKADHRGLVSTSLAVAKPRSTLGPLITALC